MGEAVNFLLLGLMFPTNFRPMRYENLLKSNLKTLLTLFQDATGYRDTTCGKIVARDQRFFAKLDKAAVRARTYDTVAARFSALWPSEVEWPADIPRPEPEEIDAETRALIEAQVAKKIEKSVPVERWRADEPWPDDVPKPAGVRIVHV